MQNAFNPAPGTKFIAGTEEASRAFAGDLERIRRALAAAQDGSMLKDAAGDIRALTQRASGKLPAYALTAMISALNDELTRRVIALACAQLPADAFDWCWIALGSEGRQEQTFASDQDNGIVFADGDDPEARRALLLPLARRINLMLAECGFTLCRGNIMASNPQCCLSLHEWRARFLEWIDEGDPLALLNASIFFDFRALHGAHALAQSLADWLAANAADNPRFLFQMSRNALRRAPPLGLLHDFVVSKSGEHAGTIDLKLQAGVLFVDAARVFGLASGCRSSNTVERLRHAAHAHVLEAGEVEEWIDAFHFIQMLRLRCQQADEMRGLAMHNHVDPDQLGREERRTLLAALRQAQIMQTRLALAYPGSAQGV